MKYSSTRLAVMALIVFGVIESRFAVWLIERLTGRKTDEA